MAESLRPIVLVVDDEPLNITIAASILKSLDCDIRAAKDGESALRLIREIGHLDLILLDVMMPGISGFDVCQTVKFDPTTKNVPVIFMSALDDEASEEKGLGLGAIDYIKKPFSIPITKARIKNHLELKAYQDVLQQMSEIDPLSQIPNRRYFELVYTKEMFRARRQHANLGCLMMDIDNFKAYNDHYGHLAGDEVIKAVAEAIKRSFPRSGDFYARYGGEEFVALLPNTDLEGVQKVAQTLLENVRSLEIPHAFSDSADIITLSIGCISVRANDLSDTNQLIDLADQNLYRAKHEGKNRCFGLECIT